MLLVNCTVILSLWCILYSFFCLFQFFKQCLCNALAFQKGPCKLVHSCSHRLVCASFFSQLSHFSSRSSFCLHKDSTHNCKARVSAVVRSASRFTFDQHSQPSESCPCPGRPLLPALSSVSLLASWPAGTTHSSYALQQSSLQRLEGLCACYSLLPPGISGPFL